MFIFDLDGTLANTEHRQHHLRKEKKDWKGWHESADNDPPHVPVFDVFCALRAAGFKCILLTGRFDSYHAQTLNWVNYYATPPVKSQDLYMRAFDDHRDDDIVKKEMLGKILLETGATVDGIFEDRHRVVQMWKKEGYYVFDCNQSGEIF